MLADKRILLVIGGGIAAYKCLDLIRRLRERGATVRVVLTPAAKEFVTPLVVGTLSENPVASELFDLTSEQEIGHIRLSRESDLVVVAPATADLIAKMANGLGNDLATSLLLANDKPVIVVPAMNPRMWAHPATRRNVARLAADGVRILGPAAGKMAERGEEGLGRMVEPMEILAAIEAFFAEAEGPKPLAGKRVVVTAGPTHEPIDPVRYIANRSSGKQGFALAAALVKAGAEVTLIAGPVALADPVGARVVRVVTACEMLAAVEATLPVDVAVMAAAVADWRVDAAAAEKIKKGPGGTPTLAFVENPDILATVGRHPALRPQLVVGFAAETENLIANARGKLERKGADVIVANDVSPKTGIMGGDRNTVRIVEASGVTDWPDLPKDEVAAQLVAMIVEKLG
ncbi:bifunctional phosphopantothenoylcysteine decarboxylase/phosphopantothenate--cysteine ligase CoaBC [Siculibacillus lacustris]|uniref:Coenzyme A biosynthesis bifunctional protein CoaBC n=1 Tax=Siculibacillus lacustris TaxID=1549641 RepID=A0A4Q9VZZ3_9HYPH|nr:bifunctional phosphopantothenoylcysteine decarboxylase/phosphopantothenate--cysteine ligase CoaBC [Siculibacillus lacustris]TBW41223.1 bifunctional phosphopantothenoylcysteine decarboxylase/phosphopantothenate--cysteine ligase CoaBC [Siculibacillus lacustris]